MSLFGFDFGNEAIDAAADMMVAEELARSACSPKTPSHPRLFGDPRLAEEANQDFLDSWMTDFEDQFNNPWDF